MGSFKKAFVFFLAALMLLPAAALYPRADALTQDAFVSKLADLRSEYPDYSVWNDWYAGGHQCWGFARLIADSVFKGSCGNWPQYNSISSVKPGDILQYGNTSGSGHTVFVTGVSGDTITFVDCNGNGNYSGGTKVRSNGVKWNNTISKGASMFGKYAFSYLLSSPDLYENNGPSDRPFVEWIYIGHLTSETFRPCLQLATDENVESVSVAVWSNNSFNDLHEYGCVNNGSATFFNDIPFANHSEDGTYFVCDFYVTLTDGEEYCAGTAYYNKDVTPPTISDVRVVSDSEGYQVTCTVDDNIGVTRVMFPSWTDNNGQDDLIWHEGTVTGNTATCWIPRSEHNNEAGFYTTHIYAYDLMGNRTMAGYGMKIGEPSRFDVNCILDGVKNNDGCAGYGTFDVYLNGVLQADDVTDFCGNYYYGTPYEIKDIKTNAGRVYNGATGALSGTIGNDNVEVCLDFSSNSYYLDLNGLLDGAESSGIDGYGTCDVYINGNLAADDVTDFYRAYPVGTRYEITDIRPTAGHTYDDVHAGSLQGTVPAEHVTVSLYFSTKLTTICFNDNYDSVAPNRLAVNLGGSVTDKGLTYSYDGNADTFMLNGTLSESWTLFSYPFTAAAGETYILTASRLSGSVSSGCLVIEMENSGSERLNFDISSNAVIRKTITASQASGIRNIRVWVWANSNGTNVFNNAVFRIKLEKASSSSAAATQYSHTGIVKRYGSPYQWLPTAERSGYTFDGWYTAPTGGTRIVSDSTCLGVDYQELYAHWTCNHHYTSAVTKEASCKEAGVRTYTCSTCGNTYTEQIAKLTEHSWDAGITRDGQRVFTCTVCGAERFEDLPAPETLAAARVSLSATRYTYDRTAKTPSVTVKNAAGEKLTKNVDYKIALPAGRTSPGVYTYTVTGVGNYTGTVEKSFKIVEVLKAARITLSAESFAYDGKAHTPSVTVKNAAGEKLTKNVDYTVSIPSGRTAVGTYTYVVKGKGIYTGTVEKSFTVEPATEALSAARITLSAESFVYDGKAHTPSVTVKNAAGKKLTKNVDYTVSIPAGRTAAGTYTYVITGIGDYTGTVSKSFTVKAAEKEDLKTENVTLSVSAVTYNGSAWSPSVTVRNANGEKLTKNVDYTVTIPAGRTEPGFYTYEIRGIGDYSGTVKKIFTVVPQA